jgi:hypothetical protein
VKLKFKVYFFVIARPCLSIRDNKNNCIWYTIPLVTQASCESGPIRTYTVTVCLGRFLNFYEFIVKARCFTGNFYNIYSSGKFTYI